VDACTANGSRDANSDPLFNQECADLIYRCRLLRYEPGTHAIQGLQVQLLLRLLRNRFEIGTESSFDNRDCIILIVLLVIVERLNG